MQRPRRAVDVVTSEVLDELVAYAPASSQAVSLNASARAIWELCDGTRTLDQICAELSEEVKPVRDASGQIDIQGTMQAVTDVVEGWVREYPDQWLWLHRRWR